MSAQRVFHFDLLHFDVVVFLSHQVEPFWSSQSGAGVSGGGGGSGGASGGGGAVGGTTSVHVPHVNWQRVVFQVSASQRDGLGEIFFSHHAVPLASSHGGGAGAGGVGGDGDGGGTEGESGGEAGGGGESGGGCGDGGEAGGGGVSGVAMKTHEPHSLAHRVPYHFQLLQRLGLPSILPSQYPSPK